MTREFTLERATKNMYRYKEEQSPNEVNEPRMCGTIYVEKRALPTKPQRIRVTVEEVTGA